VYLFGTIHMLRDGTTWQSPELEAAMQQSQDLYLEVADPANQATIASPLMKLGFDPQHPLSTKISKDDVTLLAQVAKKYGFTSESGFEPMQPWLVVLMLSALPQVHSGYAPSNGVDLQVRKEFVTAGKPVHGLETAESQIRLLSDLPESEQVTMLDAELHGIGHEDGTAQLDALVAAWLSGDQNTIASAMNWDKLTHDPMYDAMFVRRNQAFAAALAQRLKQNGTSFVSVGAGHLIGSDGVPALLAKMGFTVARVPIAAVSPAPAATVSPAPNGSPQASPSPSTAPSPTAPPTPIPVTVSPPPNWASQTPPPATGTFHIDEVWADPNQHGVILAGHIDVPGGASVLNLDTIGGLLQKGFSASAASTKVQPPAHVKICGGKENGLYFKLSGKLNQDIVVGTSDRIYLAQYVRQSSIPDDATAISAILSLCAP
jgi:uncharacterized protein